MLHYSVLMGTSITRPVLILAGSHTLQAFLHPDNMKPVRNTQQNQESTTRQLLWSAVFLTLHSQKAAATCVLNMLGRSSARQLRSEHSSWRCHLAALMARTAALFLVMLYASAAVIPTWVLVALAKEGPLQPGTRADSTKTTAAGVVRVASHLRLVQTHEQSHNTI